jgi:hypothetical protein
MVAAFFLEHRSNTANGDITPASLKNGEGGGMNQEKDQHNYQIHNYATMHCLKHLFQTGVGL